MEKISLNFRSLNLLFLIMFFSVQPLFAQESSPNQVHTQINWLGQIKFYKGNHALAFKEIKTMAKGNGQAELAIQNIRQVRTMAWLNVLSAAIPLGIGMGNLLNGNVNPTTIVLTGAGLIGYSNLFYFDSQEIQYCKDLVNALNKE